MLHTLSPGGAQDLLRHLALAGGPGVQMQVLALTPEPNAALVSALSHRGVPVVALPAGGHLDPRRVARLARGLQRAGADIVHTHGKHADVLGGVLTRATGRPVVSTLHLIEQVDGALSRLAVRGSAAVRRNVAARTIAVSEAQRRWYLQSFPRTRADQVVTVHNGVVDLRPVPDSERAAARASLGATAGEVLVVALGMMRKDRGYEHLVAAARLLHGPVVIALVGDGPERERLEAQARSAPGAPVQFPGYRTDVDAVLRAADLVVQPSLADALPTALLQALAAGAPLVASDVGGMREIVTPDVGELVPPADPVALAAAIQWLADNPTRRAVLSVAARRRYERHFTADAWATRLHDVYVQVLAGRSARN